MPSLIRVTSLCDNENLVARESRFAELPDIIQEAAVSTECEQFIQSFSHELVPEPKI